jgi:hypothetical protein
LVSPCPQASYAIGSRPSMLTYDPVEPGGYSPKEGCVLPEAGRLGNWNAKIGQIRLGPCDESAITTSARGTVTPMAITMAIITTVLITTIAIITAATIIITATVRTPVSAA